MTSCEFARAGEDLGAELHHETTRLYCGSSYLAGVWVELSGQSRDPFTMG